MSKVTSLVIAFKQWIFTCVILWIAIAGYFATSGDIPGLLGAVGFFIGALICSFPVFLVMLAALPAIRYRKCNWRTKLLLFFGLQLVIISGYAVLSGMFIANMMNESVVCSILIPFAVLSSAGFLALLVNLRQVILFFDGEASPEFSIAKLISLTLNQHSPKYTTMETEHIPHPVANQSNKLLIKGLITGGLILLMLIPGLFITNLVKEREARHKEVVKEVSSKWADAQTISGPYIVVPYTSAVANADGKVTNTISLLTVLPDNLDVNAVIIPEKRPRSIYKVLLYKSAVTIKGSFKVNWPQDINQSNIDYGNAKICFGLSDFKGIEDDIYVSIGAEKLRLNPGLPVTDFGTTGLVANLALTSEKIAAGIPFEMNVNLKGSEQLHFLPLAASSKFKLVSSWPDPSFDGNSIPKDREVNEKGFSAQWSFNRANLPFGMVIKKGDFINTNLNFGVSLVQPADQYNKTMRSVKYAILFVGLTFALFFIIEILQRKPFHPVQYVLIGLALTIFYSLLLSISEYILFDQAYLIASVATILLISLYAKGHFDSWKTAGLFAAVLSCLYGFIFTLIRIEDNALIMGSVGLFIVLAIVMYVSRKINWYGQPTHAAT